MRADGSDGVTGAVAANTPCHKPRSVYRLWELCNIFHGARRAASSAGVERSMLAVLAGQDRLPAACSKPKPTHQTHPSCLNKPAKAVLLPFSNSKGTLLRPRKQRRKA
jgi:hypothetical protein